MRKFFGPGFIALAIATLGSSSWAAPSYVNTLILSGGALDLSGGTTANTGRIGYFSDIYYDPNRNEWWGLSDRGPGGGTIAYETRVQRFTLDVNPLTGAISNFQVAQTIKFSSGGTALNGIAPNPAGTLGSSLDPEGFVINPKNGNLLISDEYGPSVYEFNRSGQMVRQYTTPANLVPKVGASTDYNSVPPTLTSGREPNRGFEGLAISPDGSYAYAMLQNGTIQDGYNLAANNPRGEYTRIVKFDTNTGVAVAQYAYKLESTGQGRGISAIVALGNDKFMVLERNNRGVGVGATVGSPDKNVFLIDLAGAVDVTGLTLPSTGAFAGAVTKQGTKLLDLDANTVAALGNKSPEKWEGLAVGPKLADGSFLLLAGTDNDYSVTQNGTGTQFDVYFDFSQADPYAASIQCPLDQKSGCTFTTGGAAATLTSAYQLLPGVLQAYKASDADLGGYLAPIPEPTSAALMLAGLLGMAGISRRRARPAA